MGSSDKKDWYKDLFDKEFIDKNMSREDDFIKFENSFYNNSVVKFYMKNKKVIKIYFLIIFSVIFLELVYLISLLK